MINVYLRRITFILALSVAAVSVAWTQSTSNWRLVAPPQSIGLVQVEQPTQENIRFVFKNASNKTILEYCVSAPAGGNEMVCEDGFATGAQLYGPGDTMSLTFDASGFVSDGEPLNVIYIRAIVYTDGSHIGNKVVLAGIEDKMIGAALETKRIADILSSETDDSIHGVDNARPQINSVLPANSADAADQFKHKSLPGISQSYIDSHLDHHAPSFLSGITDARENASRTIEDLKSTSALRPFGKNRRSVIARAVQQGRSDLAQRYQLLSHSQIGYILSFQGAENEH